MERPKNVKLYASPSVNPDYLNIFDEHGNVETPFEDRDDQKQDRSKWYAIPYGDQAWEIWNEAGGYIGSFADRDNCEHVVELHNQHLEKKASPEEKKESSEEKCAWVIQCSWDLNGPLYFSGYNGHLDPIFINDPFSAIWFDSVADANARIRGNGALKKAVAVKIKGIWKESR